MFFPFKIFQPFNSYINERLNLLKYIYSTFIDNFELAFYIPTKISIYLSRIWSRSRRDFSFKMINHQSNSKSFSFLGKLLIVSISYLFSNPFCIVRYRNSIKSNVRQYYIVKSQKSQSRQIIIFSFKKRKIQRCDKKNR